MILSSVHDLLDVLYPNCCLACEQSLVRGESYICTMCRTQLPLLEQSKTPKNNDLYKKLINQVPIESSFAFMHYTKGGIVQRLMRKLKYENEPEIGSAIGKWFAAEVMGNLTFDALIPVPLHPKKLYVRGYNQSEMIARGMAEWLDAPVYPQTLQRIVHTTSQTKKSRIGRWLNIQMVFKLVYPKQIKGKHVLLVDDIITTGATTAMCAHALLKSASRVSVATLGVTS